MTHLDILPGAWQRLFGHAMRLVDDIGAHHIRDPVWTFGGGTVLMLRHGHRRSKDVDLFVPDPQYLGHMTPRLSDVAASITEDYVEAAGYVKLILEEGEIDFVAAPTSNASVQVMLFADRLEIWNPGEALTLADPTATSGSSWAQERGALPQGLFAASAGSGADRNDSPGQATQQPAEVPSGRRQGWTEGRRRVSRPHDLLASGRDAILVIPKDRVPTFGSTPPTSAPLTRCWRVGGASHVARRSTRAPCRNSTLKQSASEWHPSRSLSSASWKGGPWKLFAS